LNVIHVIPHQAQAIRPRDGQCHPRINAKGVKARWRVRVIGDGIGQTGLRETQRTDSRIHIDETIRERNAAWKNIRLRVEISKYDVVSGSWRPPEPT